MKLLGDPRSHGDRNWLLLVEGLAADCALVVDGVEVDADVVGCFEDLRCVVDAKGRSLDAPGGTLRVEEPPADGLLRGDNGVRYRWSNTRSQAREGCWVQLLPPQAVEADEFLDPRASFCEGDVEEVWTQARYSKDTAYRVKKVDQDRYQILLDRYPPPGATLHLPVDLRNLYLQKRALHQLAEAPLPHHQGLLRLCEDPQHARWPPIQPVTIRGEDWRALTDTTRSGTDEQRAFVSKALSTSDFALMEGPPGSGKTTAICEIVQQLVAQRQRVLLCASTHVAIDNVLERLMDSSAPIYAVRIGKLDKVDDRVQETQLDERVRALVTSWRADPAMSAYGERELEEMAGRTVIMAANLTCGTTMGIVNHPLFRGRDEDLKVQERPITTMPHWDVLIVDEASKTLIQEFMVPALMARRWIVVGDVRQLPPFADRADIVANLRDLVNDADQPAFPADHRRACLLLFRLLRPHVRQARMRWLLAEPPSVLEWIARELEAKPAPDLDVVRITATPGTALGQVRPISVEQMRSGDPEALRLAAADWVLVGDDLLAEVADLLPGNLLRCRDVAAETGGFKEGSALLSRMACWLGRAGALERPYQERKFRQADVTTFAEAQACETEWLKKTDLAQEIAWRMTRLHELRHSRSTRERERLRTDLDRLQPWAVDIAEPIAEIQDIGLPSILEVLQEGIGADRSYRRSALTAGWRTTRQGDFDARFTSLSYQHRMHPEIAEFAREVIYAGQSLKDANTIQMRDADIGWDFGPFRSRRMWAHVDGREQAGVNVDEVQAMAGLLKEFISWARSKGPPARTVPRLWEVACLCFYVKQEREISEMLRQVTRDDRKTRFELRDAPVEVVCGTVDRFQGREADLVLLSMRNTRRVGFLDSPNRLNVAVTRARQQLIVFGDAVYFRGCHIAELEDLARRTAVVEEQGVRGWRRGAR